MDLINAIGIVGAAVCGIRELASWLGERDWDRFRRPMLVAPYSGFGPGPGGTWGPEGPGQFVMPNR